MRLIVFALCLILNLGFIQPVFAGTQSGDSPIYFTPGGRTSLGTFSAAETVHFKATISPLFNLSVEVLGGGDALDFGTVGEGETPPRKELVIVMKSNLRRPYQIAQEAFGPLQNERGVVIPYDRFTCVTYGFTGLKTKGELGAKQPTSVTEEPLILFVSDVEGTGDYFTVGYDVVPESNQPYGVYTTVLTYTATLL